jgi:hypothetical protein
MFDGFVVYNIMHSFFNIFLNVQNYDFKVIEKRIDNDVFKQILFCKVILKWQWDMYKEFFFSIGITTFIQIGFLKAKC